MTCLWLQGREPLYGCQNACVPLCLVCVRAWCVMRESVYVRVRVHVHVRVRVRVRVQKRECV